MTFRPSVLTAILALAMVAACAPTYVVVPRQPSGYSESDTFPGRLKGRNVQVTFRKLHITRVDTVTRWRTIYRNGARVDTVVAVVFDTVREVDTVRVGGRRPDPRRRVDTVVVFRRDTLWRTDTIYSGRPDRRGRVDTVRVVVRDTVRIVIRDTVRVPGPGGPGLPGTPGGPRIQPRPPEYQGRDTVRITVRDTVRITVRDTVRVTIRDTVRLPGQRLRVLHVPPGQYPPEGQCRIWIMDKAPGQQAEPAACNALGPIPAGAFILFRGNAWDFDYDWLHDPSAPAEIVALKRPGGGNPRTTPTAPTRGTRPGLIRRP